MGNGEKINGAILLKVQRRFLFLVGPGKNHTMRRRIPGENATSFFRFRFKRDKADGCLGHLFDFLFGFSVITSYSIHYTKLYDDNSKKGFKYKKYLVKAVKEIQINSEKK